MSDAIEEARTAFDKIYAENYWGIGSGTGSSFKVNIDYMLYITKFMENNSVGSVIDFGCGDWQFSRFIDWQTRRYFGFDLVETVISANQVQFSKENISFEVFRAYKDLPVVDLCLIKDVFQHLPITMIKEAISELKKKAKFLLITNDVYPDQWLNVEIPPGAGRAIRLEREPFFEPGACVMSYAFIAYGVFLEKQIFLIHGSG